MTEASPSLAQNESRKAPVEVGQRWRQFSTGDVFVVTGLGPRKAIFERTTEVMSVKVTVFVDRLLVDPDWTLDGGSDA